MTQNLALLPNVSDLQKYTLAPKIRQKFGADGGTSNLPPGVSVTTSTNGTADAFVKWLELQTGDGTTDEKAITGSGMRHQRPEPNGNILITMLFGLDDAPENFTDQVEIGWMGPNQDENNIAGLQFGGGTEQFIVDRAGTDSTKSVGTAFGDPLDNQINDFQLSILMSYSEPETKFWLNKTPLVDTADATIAEKVNRHRGPRFSIFGNGGSGSKTLRAKFTEVALWWG